MNKKGFTLIELMIVVAIIAIIAAIAIPSLLNARRSSNESAAMTAVRNFGSAAAIFAQSTAEGYFWDTGTTDFGTNFSHVAVKGGYNFKYFSNSATTGAGKASRFVYFAYPVSTSSGRKAYWIDESNFIFEAAELTADDVTVLAGAAYAPDFTQEAGLAALMPVPGASEWKKK